MNYELCIKKDASTIYYLFLLVSLTRLYIVNCQLLPPLSHIKILERSQHHFPIL